MATLPGPTSSSGQVPHAGFTYTDGDGTPGSTSVQWAFATLAAQGSVETGWFSGLLPCTAGPFTNDDYAVLSSTEGVTSSVGAPVTFASRPRPRRRLDQNATSVSLDPACLHRYEHHQRSGDRDLGVGLRRRTDIARAQRIYTDDGTYTID